MNRRLLPVLKQKTQTTTRRRFVQSLALWPTIAAAASFPARAENKSVLDRFWIWAHDAHSYDNAWGLPGNGRITPVEGACYMGLPNIILIRYNGKPAPPFEQYAVPFKSLKRVYWSITGAGGVTSEAEREQVLRLAATLPNLTGVFMDDFFDLAADSAAPSSAAQSPAAGSKSPGALSVEQLREIRSRLTVDNRRLDLGVTLYTHQLDPRIRSHLQLCDVVSLWTWQARDLANLEANFARFKQLAPAQRLLLGCYMWDFGSAKPMPVASMTKQCEFGLKRLREGQIEGMIFLATNICDLNLETVEWTRQWIAQVGSGSL